MRKIRGFLTIVTALLLSAVTLSSQAPDATVDWSVKSRPAGDRLQELVFSGDITEGWHIYSTKDPISASSFDVDGGEGYEIAEPLHDLDTPYEEGGNLCFEHSASFGMKVRLTQERAVVRGYLTWMACRNGLCTQQEKLIEIELKNEINKNVIGNNTNVTSPENEDVITPSAEDSKKAEGSLWALILEAILWGFAMLLTPCVFPMVPMTVSFFVKGSASPAQGRFKAMMYGLFIILLYTLPITVIIAVTRIIGGDAVTADIFNWLSTHWLPNIIFFIIFMVFAASFFGAFEITLPSSMVNKSDSKSGKEGLAGVFFMALTLVLVSFSCTGPIVGTVLIKSTQGQFWTPMVTMLAFSVAFALPFTILALFPSLLKKMKNGSWLNSVKVVLGFIEIALGFKFLSTADQTYHWGLLDREIYLAIWIVTFSLLGLYLLGKLKFRNDDPGEKPLTVFRLGLSIAVLSFVVYMVPGMWGAPLKALSGYLPPLKTQDFIVYSQADGLPSVSESSRRTQENEYGLSLPLGLDGYFTLEEGLEASVREGKPVFVDITGHGCVNCREMEQRVWSDPKVLEMLRNDYIIVALYTDDKTKLKEEDWISDASGRVYKDIGRKNSYIVRTRFNVNAQPNYVLLDSEGRQLSDVRGYDLSVEGFVDFLQKGLEEYAAR